MTVKYCTYLGTNSVAEPGVGGIAVDAAGNAYIAGYTSIAVNPFPAKNAIQSTFAGGTSDAFLMKIAPLGAGTNDLVYATLLGGSNADEALAVALDSASPPNAYVTGTTQSPDFPTNGVVGAHQPGIRLGATANAFLSVISQNAITGQTRLAYSTYFGGSQSDVRECSRRGGTERSVCRRRYVFLDFAVAQQPAALQWHSRRIRREIRHDDTWYRRLNLCNTPWRHVAFERNR